MMLSFGSILRITKLHKSKATGLPSIVILGKIHILHWTKTLKWDSKILRPGIESDVANKEARGSRGAAVAIGATGSGAVVETTPSRRSSAAARAVASATASVSRH